MARTLPSERHSRHHTTRRPINRSHLGTPIVPGSKSGVQPHPPLSEEKQGGSFLREPAPDPKEVILGDLRSGLDGEINKMRTSVKQVQEYLNELESERKSFDTINIERVLFTIDVYDNYDYDKQEDELVLSVTERGLKPAIKAAEAAYKAKNGEMKTDKTLRYHVLARLGTVDVPLRPKAWLRYSEQTEQTLRPLDMV